MSQTKLDEILKEALLNAVKGRMKDVLSKYIDKFATVLIEKMVKKAAEKDKKLRVWTPKEVITIYYDVTKNMTITLNKPGRAKKIDQEDYGTCKYQDKKYPENKCSNMISKKSQTKVYCAKHSKLLEKKSNLDEHGEMKKCDQPLKTGVRKGQLCGKNVTPKSLHLCSKHHHMEEKTKKDKILQESDSEDEEVIEEEEIMEMESEVEEVIHKLIDIKIDSQTKGFYIIGENQIRYQLEKEAPNNVYAKLIDDEEQPLDFYDHLFLKENGHTYIGGYELEDGIDDDL